MFKDLVILSAISFTISAVEKQENKIPSKLNWKDQVIYMKIEAHSSLKPQTPYVSSRAAIHPFRPVRAVWHVQVFEKQNITIATKTFSPQILMSFQNQAFVRAQKQNCLVCLPSKCRRCTLDPTFMQNLEQLPKLLTNVFQGVSRPPLLLSFSRNLIGSPQMHALHNTEFNHWRNRNLHDSRVTVLVQWPWREHSCSWDI